MLAKFMPDSGLIYRTVNNYTLEELPKLLQDGYIEISQEDCELYATLDYAYDFETGAPKMLPTPEPPTEEEIQRQLTAAVQAYMDKTVQQRGYDNILTACSYVNSTDHIFAAEGLACVQWRDAVWRKCYDMLAEVKAGTRAIPTAEEVIAELPVLEW